MLPRLLPIIYLSYFSLTISTLTNLKEEMVLLDMHGRHHKLPISVLHRMLVLGWASFFLGWLMNLIFYGVHPCEVSLTPASLKHKLPPSLSSPVPQSPAPFNNNVVNHRDGEGVTRSD